jgi:4-amino-4-deoxy-L-arabinose transferase-like glycosyltransferase
VGDPTPPPSSPPPPSLREPARAFPLALLAAIQLSDLVRFGHGAGEGIRTPYSRDYGEGCVLAMVQLLAERGNYFTSLRDYPYVHGNYPPVFPLINLPAYLWLGPTLLVPRLLSVLATLALVLVLVRLVRRETGSLVLGGSFGLLLLGPWFVQTWASLGRVDMVACLFSLAGLHLFHRFGPEGRGRWLGYACLWLAFFTKQNALLAPAAVVLGLALDPATRARTGRVLAEIALPLLGLFGTLCLVTGGEAYNHLIPYTAAAHYEWERMGRACRDFFTLIGPLVALIVPAAVALGSSAIRGSTASYLAYWLMNLAALVTISKAGAAQNYFIEPYVATLALAALLLGQAARASRAVARAWPAYVIVVALVVTLTDREKGRSRLPPQEPQELAELYAIVGATSGPILSEDLSALVLNRKPVLVEPFGALLISSGGHMDTDRIVADCRQGRFPLVVTDFRLRDIAGMDACLSERYESWKRLGPYELLRPRPAADDPLH